MIIPDVLTQNARLYPNDASLVEVNPEIREKIDKAWEEFDLVESVPKPASRKEITWGEFEGKANICKVNTDEENDLASKFGIRSVPTIIFIKNGEVVAQMVGVASEQVLKDKINSLLQ